TAEQMQALADRIAAGDSTGLTKLEGIADELYRGIDYRQDRPRVMANLKLMRAAFDRLGEAASGGNAKAMAALKSSLRSSGHLRSFAPDALGTVAAAGNKEAMDILLDYKKTGVLLSSTVFALKAPAAKNDPRAVKFLIDVTKDPKSKGLWDWAMTGLKGAAEAGNAEAQTAIDQCMQSN